MMNTESISVKNVSWQDHEDDLRMIRKVVFIDEQNVSFEDEYDGLDASSTHLLAYDYEKKPIGTARILKDGHLGRLAVLKHKRGAGVGKALVVKAIEMMTGMGFSEIVIHAQEHALPFYESFGFVKEGGRFMEAGIPHYLMKRPVP